MWVRLLTSFVIGSTIIKLVTIGGTEVPQKHLHEHFMREKHQSLEKDVEITLIEKTNPSDPTKHEDFWICALGTMAPKGLNVALF